MTRYSPLTGTEFDPPPIEDGAGWTRIAPRWASETAEALDSVDSPVIIARDGEPVAIVSPVVLRLLESLGALEADR